MDLKKKRSGADTSTESESHSDSDSVNGSSSGSVSGIHSVAAGGFGVAGEAYDRGRPEYPAAAVDFVISALGLDAGSTVVDLGAGTGKFTRALARSGARLLAVEPVEGMRRKLALASPDILVVEGTAEDTRLGSGSVDAVVSAQAFHWFDGPRALTEIARILRPAGRLAIVWNIRDESVDWVRRLTDVFGGVPENVPTHRGGLWKEAFNRTSQFTPLERATFDCAHTSTHEMVVDRVLSISYLAILPKDKQLELADKVRELLRTHPQTKGQSLISFPYRTEVYWCSKA